MDVTINTTTGKAAAAIDGHAGLATALKAVAKSAVSAANPPAGPLEVSVATGGEAGWMVIRVAPYKELN